ncbi:secretoglobin family 3A member 1 [Molossus molossus]|uniref:Secretoglobin family 3A member 1 n=1 Tax=Molossus molossus TaxID=27622 RepID=A0A7J8ICA6_MOLMO|nr:secretoglobin family 3A member 1 [Molossus molossus]KAF6481948.1 secretoglobin family 3A member 1 [Molossus molossus]
MKLTTAFLVLCVALLSQCTAAFFMNKMAKPVAPTEAALAPAMEDGAGAGTVAYPFFKGFNPVKFVLASLGIPVDHLVEGSRKCVAELGPESMGAMKALLGALTFFG